MGKVNISGLSARENNALAALVNARECLEGRHDEPERVLPLMERALGRYEDVDSGSLPDGEKKAYEALVRVKQSMTRECSEDGRGLELVEEVLDGYELRERDVWFYCLPTTAELPEADWPRASEEK